MVILFILIIQFISKYKDHLFGKGLEAIVIGKIFMYSGAHMFLLALPPAVLLSALVTTGAFGEHYELTAMRSAGINLFRVLWPMVRMTLMVSFLAFVFSVYIVPESNLKLFSLLYDVQQARPSFNLRSGHFYDGIEGYMIRVHKKEASDDMLYDIMIYDHTPSGSKVDSTNRRVVLADSGQIMHFEEKNIMQMVLYDGVSHESFKADAENSSAFRYGRYYFDTLVYRFNMSGFGLSRTAENEFATHEYMMKLGSLDHAIDSIGATQEFRLALNFNLATSYLRIDSIPPGLNPEFANFPPGKSLISSFPGIKPFLLVSGAISGAEKLKTLNNQLLREYYDELEQMRKYRIEWHSKFALPSACLIFLMIGAPLGTITRKGSLGLPVILSIGFFIVFYLLMIQGKKYARDEVMPVWIGVWLPILVLTPVAMFVTYEATIETRFLTKAFWYEVAKPIRSVMEPALRLYFRYVKYRSKFK